MLQEDIIQNNFSGRNMLIKDKKLLRKIFILLSVAATFLRIFLCKGLMVYFIPGTQYDDIMQISKAFSIIEGNWLGEYGSMTLVKGVGYPLLVAIFHFLHIPYIQGFHLIYIIGCIVFAWAIYPLIKNDCLCFLAYMFVLFNPIAFSNVLTKYYRDIAYYALCMVFISATVGLLIRQKGKAFAVISGIALAWCILCREDGQWLYIYIASCIAVPFIYRSIADKKLHKGFIKEIRLIVISYAVIVLCICSINYKYYGTFVLDEYNSGAYADAYGAISRLHGERGNTQVVIPYSEREKLYEYSPSFARLKPYLDGDNPKFEPWKIYNDDYRTGYFSFNLRDAIQDLGYYRDAASTNQYLRQLAEEVNQYCDIHAENVYRKRSTIVSRFYPEHIPHILNSTLEGIKQTVIYTGVSCIPLQCEEDDLYLKRFEEITDSVIAGNRYMETGEIIENYHLTGFSRWMQRIMRVLIIVYRIATPVLFSVSLIYFIYQTFILIKKYSDILFVQWISAASLLALFLLRTFMIGYVDATSYSAISNPAYQAGSYVVMGCFISLQCAVFIYEITSKVLISKDRIK